MIEPQSEFYPVQAPIQAAKLSPVLLPHARTLFQGVKHMDFNQ